MYMITSAGGLLALCDRPRYVRQNAESGAWVETDRETAEAIAVNGTLYNLPGGTAVEGAAEAEASEADAAEYVFQNRVRIEENQESTGAAIVAVEEAMCENDAETDGRLTEVENALCELDEAISGSANS